MSGRDQDGAARDAARAELGRAVQMSQELLEAHMNSAGHRTSAEWLTACIERMRVLNLAAGEYLRTDPAPSPA